jgi:hypothetical protein
MHSEIKPSIVTTALAADVHGDPFYGATTDFYAPPQLDLAGETATLIATLGARHLLGEANYTAHGMITHLID